MARVFQVTSGEQHLPGDDAVAVKAFLISEDEHVLPDRRCGLLGGKVGLPIAGPVAGTKVWHPGGNGSG